MKRKIKTSTLYLISAFAIASVAAIGGTALLTSQDLGEDAAEIVVYKTPTCGCCTNWVGHLRRNGLNAKVVNMPSTEPIHERLGVPHELGSCHTAKVGDYWVEGHVPADLVQRLITEKPGDIRGIAVPGMPMGSPGMEGPNPVEYKVIAYSTDGSKSVYATRQGQSTPQ